MPLGIDSKLEDLFCGQIMVLIGFCKVMGCKSKD